MEDDTFNAEANVWFLFRSAAVCHISVSNKGREKKTPGKTVRMQNIPPYMLHLQGYLIDEPIKTAVNHFESVVNYSLSSKSSP